MIGIYIHVPFCVSKCPYCDFYSLTGCDDHTLDRYATVMCQRLKGSAPLYDGADSLYFGGGTPSLLGGKRIAAIIEAAADGFGLRGAEITFEANPADDLLPVFRDFAAAGGNRISLGMQSSDGAELKALGRRHTPDQLERAVAAASTAGIGNLSLDVMLGIPGQTVESGLRSIKRCHEWGAKHVSMYILKLEPGTPFGQAPPALPEEDAVCDLYLAAGEELERLGYRQYEISNYAVPGYESRHNLKYWNSGDYLGIGPGAHSFLGGKRFAYPRDLAGFLDGAGPVPEPETDIIPGSPEEYALLRLRLCDGLTETGFRQRFGRGLPAKWKENAARLPKDYVKVTEEAIRFTRKGFLVSNTLIAKIIA